MQTKLGRGLKYATSFHEKLLGVGCDIDVVVELETGELAVSVAMRHFLRSSSPFRISEEELVGIAEAITSVQSRARLLDDPVEGARDHQLNYSSAGVSLIVVHPKGRPARFVLTIGSFSQEGALDALSRDEIDAALTRIEELKARTRAKVLAEE